MQCGFGLPKPEVLAEMRQRKAVLIVFEGMKVACSPELLAILAGMLILCEVA